MTEPLSESREMRSVEARRVVEALDEIVHVLQATGSYSRFAQRVPESWTLRFAHRSSPVVQEKENEFAFLVGFLCEAVLPADHPDTDPQYPESQIPGASDRVLFQCQADFVLRYRLQSGAQVTPEELAAFAKSNGVFNAQPLWREFLLSSALRAQATPIIAPVMKLTDGSLPRDGTKATRNAQ